MKKYIYIYKYLNPKYMYNIIINIQFCLSSNYLCETFSDENCWSYFIKYFRCILTMYKQFQIYNRNAYES